MANVIKLRGFGEIKKVLPVRVLLHKDGTPVKIGDTVKSGRGETATVTGWPNNGHNRVWIKWNDDSMGTEYFPHVFDLKWGPFE